MCPRYYAGRCERSAISQIIPDFDSVEYLTKLCKAEEGKYTQRLCSTSRNVTSDLYYLWSISSSMNTEMFTDWLNEIASLSYCYIDNNEDIVFGSIRSWDDVGRNVEGGGCNPPFDEEFIEILLNAFDKGARSIVPYFHCVLLPNEKAYETILRTSWLSSKDNCILPQGFLSSPSLALNNPFIRGCVLHFHQIYSLRYTHRPLRSQGSHTRLSPISEYHKVSPL